MTRLMLLIARLKLIVRSVESNPTLTKLKPNLVCFLEVGKWDENGAVWLKIAIWALNFEKLSTNEDVRSGNPNYYGAKLDDPGLLDTIRLVRIAGDFERLPSRRVTVHGRGVSSTVNFSLLRKLLSALDSGEGSTTSERLSTPFASTTKGPNAGDWKDSTRIRMRDPSGSKFHSLSRGRDDFGFIWTLSPSFRLIDVQQRCLVDPPTELRFVALSYVWGNVVPPVPLLRTASRSSLYTPNAISHLGESVPRTVRDAIIATRCLGYRYLWTDALCIVQDDEEEKEEQINKMASVYRRASFTIVAAAGHDANAGLPGVGSTGRPQWQCIVGNGRKRFANEGRNLDDCLIDCHWLTRGWTYQELALSSRLFVFTEQEVFVVDARQAITMEDAFAYRSESYIGRRKTVGIAGSFDDHLVSKPRDALRLYGTALHAYSQRKLTFRNDVFNAFQGIAGYLDQQFRGKFTFGVPNTFLDFGLSWVVSQKLEKNKSNFIKNCPSYSWASSGQAVFMIECPFPCWPSSRVLWRNFHPQREEDWICEDDFIPGPGTEEAQKWEFVSPGTFIREDRSAREVRVTRPFWKDTTEHPTWQHARPSLPTQLLPPFQPTESGTGYLHLWTHVVALTLVPTEHGQWTHAVSSGHFAPSAGQYGVDPGQFEMDRPTIVNPIEAILLYRFERHNGFPGPVDRAIEDPPLPWDAAKLRQDAVLAEQRRLAKKPQLLSDRDEYVVMAIETVDGISYRRGIGTVEVSWFHQAGPQRRYIVLG